jgi:prophage regulatory protein
MLKTNEHNMDRFLRRPEVEQITSLNETTIWREEKAGRFPKRYNLTKRTVGWLASEINDWMVSRTTSAGDFSNSKPGNAT